MSRRREETKKKASRMVVVKRDAILRVDPGEYARLIQAGSCVWSYYELVVEGTDRQREVPGPADRCLALDKSRSDFWFEFDPETDLNLLLDWACLATYDGVTRQITRIGKASLREELMYRSHHNSDARPFAPVHGARDGYGNFFEDSAVEVWQRTAALFGQLAVCGCGEPGCGATYAWLTGTTGMLVIEISAAGMYRVEIGPFPLVAPVTEGGQ
jgi:hypothetical protein